MKNEEYKKSLENETVKSLKELFEKVFGNRPPSKYTKANLVEELYQKFCEVNNSEEAEEPVDTPETEGAETQEKPKQARASRNGSRRGFILRNVVHNIWDTNTLAEAIGEVYGEAHPDWELKKNKAAIAGTLADMRRNHGWVTEICKDNRIIVRS